VIDSSALLSTGQVWVVIPIKSFELAKQRLQDVLTSPERKNLAEKLAIGVLLASAPLPIAVVCADETVAAVARDLGAHIVSDPSTGLNDAVQAGVLFASGHGGSRVVVVHADIPMIDNLSARLRISELQPNDALLVPDRRLDGTNIVSVPIGLPIGLPTALPIGSQFRFQYGKRSFLHHRAEAIRCGMRVIERRDTNLSLDIDTAEDLHEWKRRLTF
jgi:2-phospho-L-lactate/phosphoenolpyruvate guanylyltransferase